VVLDIRIPNIFFVCIICIINIIQPLVARTNIIFTRTTIVTTKMNTKKAKAVILQFNQINKI